MSGRAFVSRFSPNRTDPALLEAIFVQRHRLAEVWLERLKDSIRTEAKHHLLAVGPRGCGKSHLVVLLLSRLRRDKTLSERVRIAWLPEDETTASFWKFLLRILRALHTEYGDEFPPPPREKIAAATEARRSAFLTDYLLKKLGKRTLLVVVENLDDVMSGLKDDGQKRWRAFLQEHAVAATLATAQQLTTDLSKRDKPFFNFFQVEPLLPLSIDEALSLLRKIAERSSDSELAPFLQTPTGRARVRAIRHIAGGSHRVFIILSEFLTRRKLDDLVTAFEELLDELTPYYQERLRWLPDQQREIVEFLCRQVQTISVKETAAELFLTEQTTAAQLKSLREKGYVTSSAFGRESRYELAEPLMRLCVEVKDPQREPIRLIVEFLRIWYDRREVEAKLMGLPRGARMERLYLRAALQAHRPEIPSPIVSALRKDLEKARASGKPEELTQVLVEFAATTDSAWICLGVAGELRELGCFVETLAALDRAVEIDSENAVAWNNKGYALIELGRHTEALTAFDRAISIDPRDYAAWHNKGYAMNELGRHTEALVACDRAIESDPENADFWSGRGYTLSELGRHAEALAALDRAVGIDPEDATTWHNKGLALSELGRHAEALAAFDRAVGIDPKNAGSWKCRGRTKFSLGRLDDAMADFRKAIDLDSLHIPSLDSLAEALVSQGNWDEAEQILYERFRLLQSTNEVIATSHFPDLLATIFLASGDRKERMRRVGRLADVARDTWKPMPKKIRRARKSSLSSESTSPKSVPQNPFILIGSSLVVSLTTPAYAESTATAIEGWVDAWRQAAERYPDLSLAVRLFGVGVRYTRTKDERALLDLVQEERSILRNLFGLDEG